MGGVLRIRSPGGANLVVDPAAEDVGLTVKRQTGSQGYRIRRYRRLDRLLHRHAEALHLQGE